MITTPPNAGRSHGTGTRRSVMRVSSWVSVQKSRLVPPNATAASAIKAASCRPAVENIGGVVAAAYLTWVVRVSGLVDWWPAMPSVFLVMVTVQGLAAYWLLLRPAARGVA